LNLARSLSQVRAGLTHEKNPAPGAKSDDKTEFTEMKLTAQIRDGVAESSDLDAKSPLLRVGGAGRLDIGTASLDYLAKATIVSGGAGREGRELASLKGKTIPVKLAGPLDALKYDIEYVPAAPPPAARGRAQDKGRTAPRGRTQ
jgi:AsmA protein